MKSALLPNIVLATLLMLFVALGLSIGFILTGKSRLKKRCGSLPKQNKDGNGTPCSLCGKKEDCHDRK